MEEQPKPLSQKEQVFLQTVELDALKIVAKGKTKSLYEIPGHPDLLLMVQKDNLTYKNGLVNESIPAIGKFKALQNHFAQNFLKTYGINTSYIGLNSDNKAIVKPCDMLGLEMVYRNDAGAESSWAKRNPGQPFPKNGGVVEIFDKRTIVTKDGAVWFMDEAEAVKEYGKDKDVHSDPFVEIIDTDYGSGHSHWNFYDQTKPIVEENLLETAPAPYEKEIIDRIIYDTKKVQTLLTAGLSLAGKELGKSVELIDGKVEYGKLEDGSVALSDDITADAVRLKIAGQESSKQVFRNECDAWEQELNGNVPTDRQKEAFTAKLRRIMPDAYERVTEVFSKLDDVTL